MKNPSGTKQELIKEISFLKQRIKELEQAESERKRAEVVIRHNEKKLQTIFKVLPVGVSLLDADHKIVQMNPALEKILDISEEGLLSGSYKARRYIRSDGTPMPPTEFASNLALKEQRAIYDVDIGVVKEDGTIIWTKVNAAPLHFNGECVVVVTRDITEHKKAEEQLHYQARLLQNVSDAMVSTDYDFRIVSWNQAAERLYGWHEDQVIGKVFCDIVPTEYRHADRADVLAEFRKKGIWQGESIQQNKDGHAFYVFSSVVALLDQVGNPIGAIAVNRDITDRKQVEEKIQVSLREKDILINEIHHRVKNNLQVISGLLYLQTKGSKNPEMIESFRQNQERIQAMALIHEKLHNSKDFKNIDLSDYVRSLSEELFRSYNISPGEVDLSIKTDGDVYMDIIKAVPCGLILNELISNALKYAFSGDRQCKLQIIVSKTKSKEMAIVVRDNGSGLPDDVDIHEPQSVGLDLVNGLVTNQLDGQIEVKRDNGTEFRITFPL